jgi:peptidyl-prolyl cis-trans isomerase D
VHIWAFEATEGQTSSVIETDWAYYVFRLDSVLTEQVPPLDEIRDAVRRMALQQIQWERTRTMAEEIRTAVEGGSDLQQAAAQFGLNVQQTDSFTRLNPATAIRDAPDAIGAAFGLDLTRVGGPYESEYGLFFIEPTRKFFADSAEFESGRGLMLAQLIQQATQQRVQLVVNSLREQANVVDNRQALEAARRQAANQQLPGSGPLGF